MGGFEQKDDTFQNFFLLLHRRDEPTSVLFDCIWNRGVRIGQVSSDVVMIM